MTARLFIRRSILLVPALFLLLGGCLKRKETIVLHADGRLDVEHAFVGDGDDIDQGPARRPEGQGYKTSRTSRTLEDGNVEDTWIARASYASAKDMPTSFAAPGDPFASRAHSFRTSVLIREENGRTYYRFVRSYAARDWATYGYFRRVCFPEEIQKLYEEPDEIPDLSLADRQRLIGSIVRYQCMQMQLWADRALARIAPEAPSLVDAQLAVRAHIERHCREHLAAEKVVGVLSRPTSEVVTFAENAQQAMRKLIVERAQQALALGAEKVRELEEALLLEQHDFEVSHDLEDEDFVVRLKMPGRIVGSNADKRDGDTLVWAFHARDLRDRRHVLIATSVVER